MPRTQTDCFRIVSQNWVGGKRYIGIYLLLYVYRPPTPPYMRFRIRRFRAFSSHDVWQVVFSHPVEKRHFQSIVGFRPIV